MANTNFFKNGRALRLLVLYTGVFAAIWACEEEVEPTVSDPSVSIFFLNKTKLDEVNLELEALDEELVGYDTTIENLEDDADILVDRLIDVLDSIAEGWDKSGDSTVIANNLEELNENLEILEYEDSVAKATRSIWADTASTISSGSLKISSIQNLKNGQAIAYEDSSTSWKLPLDMQADDIDVDIAISDAIYNLKLTYVRSTTANEKNKVVIKTSNFKITSTDFNNPSLSCDDCDNTKTTIYVEF
ncbi:hypothetical protein SAMN04488029_3489 [Reichenbachiella faecimaris]|uniref:Uncharacterized protein n=1 Tax=Reichenbachiella faecimaris TaxID=692418 RepID=A0A1W2GMM6_REIFA|nr:hypothetical protein [Reichenbachiella faecimaris]SMD37851.1 hypothetical protein SAMN04488029_3489 [Reichenbachiella faecimaris]